MIKLDEKELKLMEYAATSRNFKTWMGLFEKIIKDVTDVSNFNKNKDLAVQLEAALLTKQVIEDVFVNRFKVLSGRTESNNPNEFS